MSTLIQVLSQGPLVAAFAWFALATFQVYRDRYHTWTEVSFLATCFFAGLYGLGDWFFFNAGTTSEATLAALLGTSSLVLAELFFLLFTLIYVDRMRRIYWIFAAVSAGMVALTWGFLLVDVRPPPPDGLYVPVFRPIAFILYLVYVVAYGIVGVWNLLRLRRIVKKHSKALARRATGLVVTFSLILLLGLATNGYLGLTGNSASIPPPFSTLLIFVAANAYYTLFPSGRERISEAIRRFQQRFYEVRGAFVIYRDGTLIGSETAPGEKIIDQDLFSATLDVIQNFMRTSFPTLRGSWLRTITHGEYTLVLERGRYTYIVLMIHGQENDQLRRLMRDQLIAFEADNQSVLANWRGVPTEAKGTSSMLLSLFED